MSQAEGQLPSEQVPFRTIQIVIGALMFGALLFAVIAFSVAQPPRAGNELLAYVAAGFAGLQLVMSLVVPAIAIRQKLQELQARSSASGSVLAMDYFNVYQTRSIVRAALLERRGVLWRHRLHHQRALVDSCHGARVDCRHRHLLSHEESFRRLGPPAAGAGLAR